MGRRTAFVYFVNYFRTKLLKWAACLYSHKQDNNILHSKQGTTIKRLDKNVFIDGEERKAEFEISVPSVGKYTVTVEKPIGTDIFFISKITLQMLKGSMLFIQYCSFF